MIHYQDSENGKLMLITVAQPLDGPQAGRDVSCTKLCDTREEAMSIMLRNPPIVRERSCA